jgi:hypothetical protein
MAHFDRCVDMTAESGATPSKGEARRLFRGADSRSTGESDGGVGTVDEKDFVSGNFLLLVWERSASSW